MIRYAITAGNYGLFRNGEGDAPATCLCDPIRGDVLSGPDSTAFLAFPPAVSLPDQARHLAQQGVDWMQLRERHLPPSALAALARQILTAFDEVYRQTGRQTRLLINGRADVAAATGAHGVHLPAAPGALAPAQVRSLYRSIGLARPYVSLACRSVPAVRRAVGQSPDLILFSPVFGKCVGGLPISPAIGLEALAAACALADPIPVLALGGITAANTAACLHAGAAGVAGIRLFSPSAKECPQA